MKTANVRRNAKRRFILRLYNRMEENPGQSLVEAALTLPILLVMVVGAAEFGRLAYAAIEVANAARAGVAYGAQDASTAQDITGMETAASNDGGNISGWQTPVATETCTCSDGTAISCLNAAACVSPAHEIQSVQVNTSATINPLFHVPGLPRTYTLNGQAIMRVE